MKRERTKKERLRADLLLAAALLLLSGALLLYRRVSRTEGAAAAVYVDNVLTAVYPLGEDRTVKLGEGEYFNVLEIRAGAADMTEADCPDKLCVGMHPIRYVGETIICLPHRLMIQIQGPGEPEVDIP